MRAVVVFLSALTLLFGAYTRNATDATVYDDETQLTWIDSYSKVTKTMTWESAVDYCEAMVYAGADDWRLPNANELLSITDISRVSPAIDSTFQSYASQKGYWTSTTYLQNGNPAWAWIVGIGVGRTAMILKDDQYNVRCVRSEESNSSLSSPTEILPAMLYLIMR